MASEGHEAVILRDDAGAYYAIPAAALARYRVPAEHAAAVERAVGAAGDDTAGFAQGHGQGHGQGQGHGHGQGQGQGRGLGLIAPLPVRLPFPSLGGIADGTSNTIAFGER